MAEQQELDLYVRVRAIVARLRAPDGCPWDREQTHESLRPFAVQEAYEVVAAIDAGEIEALPDEMGDLLFQVLLHTQLAEEAGEYTMAQVLDGLAQKLVRRHPHVFGETKVSGTEEVLQQWEELKKAERPADASALAGLPRAMAALGLAQETLRRAAVAGFAWPRREDVLTKLAEELNELANTKDAAQRAEEFGDVLINVANYARYINVDAEEALRLATQKFRRRFEGVEDLTRARSLDMTAMSREQLMELWTEAKAGLTNEKP